MTHFLIFGIDKAMHFKFRMQVNLSEFSFGSLRTYAVHDNKTRLFFVSVIDKCPVNLQDTHI